MSLTLEFEFEDVHYGHPGLRTITVRDAQAAPRVGDHASVDGYREVLAVRHYFGVAISNGEDGRDPAAHRNMPNGRYQTVYVTLSPRKKHPREV